MSWYGGLITTTPVAPSSSAAPGVWTLDEALQAKAAGNWPAFVSAVSTLTFQNSSVSSASTITLPGSIAAGDLIIIYDCPTSSNSTIPSSVVPADFTPAYDQGIANASFARRIVISYKIADGSESSAVVTGTSGSGSDSKAALVFRGDVAVSTVTPTGFTHVMQDSNPTAQVVPSGSGAAPLIVLAGYAVGGTATINPRSFSPAEDGEITIKLAADHYVKYKIYNSSPADVTVDMDDEGNRNTLISGYLAVT